MFAAAQLCRQAFAQIYRIALEIKSPGRAIAVSLSQNLFHESEVSASAAIRAAHNRTLSSVPIVSIECAGPLVIT